MAVDALLTPAPTTLERLRVFHAVATAGTIAGAARALSYTPSAVSQHLATLEREAGAALVERSNRGIVLTAAGQLLAARASTVLDLVRNALDEVGTAAGRSQVSITVAAFPTAITTMLLPLLDRLTPSIRLTIIDAESEAALDALRARRVDCAITDGLATDSAAQHRPHADDLHRTVIRTEPLRLVARADRVEHTLESYRDAGWVLFKSGSRLGNATRDLCATAGFTPTVIAETDDHHTTFDIVRTTGAVAVLPALALTSVPEGITIAEHIDVPIERRIELVTRQALRDHHAVVELAHHLDTRRPQ